MTLCPNDRKVQLKVCVYSFGRVRRDSAFSSFYRNLFSVIQFSISDMYVLAEVIGLGTSWERI